MESRLGDSHWADWTDGRMTEAGDVQPTGLVGSATQLWTKEAAHYVSSVTAHGPSLCVQSPVWCVHPSLVTVLRPFLPLLITRTATNRPPARWTDNRLVFTSPRRDTLLFVATRNVLYMEAGDSPTVEEEVNLPLPLRMSQPAIDYLPYWAEATAKQRIRIAVYNTAIYLPVAVKLSLILSIYPIYVLFFIYPMVYGQDSKPELYYWHTSSEHHQAKIEAGILLSVLTFFMTMYCISFYKASQTGPGSVPNAEDWKLSKSRHPADSPNAQFMIERKQTTGEVRTCSRCSKLKPDRSHHCRLCDTCVLKMDHHCPWIANCVGYFNYKYFFLMVTYGMLGLWIFVGTFWETVLITQRNDESSYLEIMFVTSVYAIVNVLNFAVTGFWIFHLYLISQAHTTIEFCEKRRRKAAEEDVSESLFKRNPFENFKDALGDNPWLWPFPCCKVYAGFRGPIDTGLFFASNRI